MRRLLALVVGAAALVVSVQAQFLPVGQACSEEEYDDYLAVLLSSGAEEAADAAHRFERRWPGSALAAGVLTLRLDACRALGDRECLIEAGRRALESSRNNVPVLVALASTLPNQSEDPQEWTEAAAYAGRALEALEDFHPPVTTPLEDWLALEARLKAEARAALGLVRFKQGRVREAVELFEQAVNGAPAPDPAQIYRLGKLYQLKNRTAEAERMFRRLLELPNEALRERARQELRLSP